MAIIKTNYGDMIVDDDIAQLLRGKNILMRSAYLSIDVAHLVAPPSPEPGLVLDHINKNPQDNRRENLLWVSYQKNSLNRRKFTDKNSSQYKGVTWHKSCKKWRSR